MISTRLSLADLADRQTERVEDVAVGDPVFTRAVRDLHVTYVTQVIVGMTT
jgi:hypothetical protein